MFQIVALLFLITNGTPSTEPDETIFNRRQFQTMEACETFLNSEEGTRMQETITTNPEFQEGKVMVKFGCRMTKDPGINPDSPPRQ